MKDQAIQLKLDLNLVPDVDVEELDELTRQLRFELLHLDNIDSVDLVSHGKEPEGSKALGTFNAGSLLLALTPAGGVLTTLITAVQSWLSMKEKSEITREFGSIILEIDGDKLEIANIKSEERLRLIDLWISRHKQ